MHNFLTKQNFKLKFWILVILMSKLCHMTILTKFDQIFGQILAKLGQILVKIFKISKSDIFGIHKCWSPNFEKIYPLDQILMLVKFQNLVQWVKFFKIWKLSIFGSQICHFLGFWKFWPKFGQVWPKFDSKFGQIWPKWSCEILFAWV